LSTRLERLECSATTHVHDDHFFFCKIKAAGTKAQDELEKQMMKEDRERDAPFKAKKLKREEDQDKDWNPKGRR